MIRSDPSWSEKAQNSKQEQFTSDADTCHDESGTARQKSSKHDTILVLTSNAVAACARIAAENRAAELAMSLAHCSVMRGADAFCAAPPLKAGSAPFCSHVATASNRSIV